jgi:hypothetical protein
LVSSRADGFAGVFALVGLVRFGHVPVGQSGVGRRAGVIAAGCEFGSEIGSELGLGIAFMVGRVGFVIETRGPTLKSVSPGPNVIP